MGADVRVAELTKRAVAMVHVTRGVIDWAAESRAFLGKVVRGDRVAEGTVAARLTKEPASDVVSDEIRGRSRGTFGRVVEEAVWTDYGSVIAWVRGVS